MLAFDVQCKKERSNEGYPTNPPTSKTNNPPIGLAGTDLIVTLPTDSILLDGSPSNDPDGNIIDWQWTKISGPVSFNIANANNVQTEVSNLLQGVYKFELKVADAGGLIARDTMLVTVNQQPFHYIH